LQILVDTHIHSVASGHAYSTIQEIAAAASKKGLKIAAITDHGPEMKGAASVIYFGNYRVIPENIYGVRILKGIEANIIDYDGNIDLPVKYLKKMEFVIASLHEIIIQPSTMEDHTNAFVNVLKNPYIDAVGHPGNPVYKIDIEKVVATAKEYNKLIEINNSSFRVRKGSYENCKNILKKCKEYRTRVVCGSDAHISFDVGVFDKVNQMLQEVDMPEELVLSVSPRRFEDYLIERKNRLENVGQGAFVPAL
jgi:putative hydrolase